MILLYLIVILLAGALLAWAVGSHNPSWSRFIAIGAVGLDLVLTIIFMAGKTASDEKWLADLTLNWIPGFGISLHLALDGLSLVMLLLTFFLGIISVVI